MSHISHFLSACDRGQRAAAAGAAGQGRGPSRHPLHQTLWREVRIQTLELVPSSNPPFCPLELES